jgi:hypothetical protein
MAFVLFGAAVSVVVAGACMAATRRAVHFGELSRMPSANGVLRVVLVESTAPATTG